MSQNWQDIWNERIDFEVNALVGAGISIAQIDRDSKNCQCAVHFKYTTDAGPIDLTARFPPYYPFVRFEVSAPGLNLHHHQAPLGGNLCFFKRSLWRSSDTLLSVLEEQLVEVLAVGQSIDKSEVAAREEDQAEPNSVYVHYELNSVALIPDELIPQPPPASGVFNVRVGSRRVYGAEQVTISVEGADSGRLSSSVKPSHLRALSSTTCKWVRLNRGIGGLSGDECVKLLESSYPNLAPKIQGRGITSHKDFIGVVFQEESARRELTWSVVFLMRTASLVRGMRRPISRAKFIRTFRIGRETMFARAPELAPLSEKTIAIIGTGCVGAPLAIELAKAGVGTIKLMDEDIVDPATTLRWPLGLQAAGLPKVSALLEFIGNNYPYTKGSGEGVRLGGVVGEGGASFDVVNRFFENVDLVIDTTGDDNVGRIVGMEARARGVAHAYAASTPGGWGGTVALFDPEKGGCFDCYLMALGSSSKNPAIPDPPTGPLQEVQSIGCNDPTFVASGFDISQVSLAAARKVVSYLCRGVPEAYPELPIGVDILALRTPEGEPILPKWNHYDLEINPACGNH